MRLQLADDLFLRTEAGHTDDRLATFEEDQRGDAHERAYNQKEFEPQDLIQNKESEGRSKHDSSLK